MRETQPEGLKEAQLGDLLEGEMVKDFIPKALWKEMKGILKQGNGHILQVKEEGGVVLPSTPLQPTAGHPRTPPTPAPSEDRLFTDWSSIGSRSLPVIAPPQSVPIGGTLVTPGIEGIHETEQAALQPSQPISQESHIGTMSHAVQEDLPTVPNVCQQPLKRSIVPSERRITDMRTNTSDVIKEPTGSGPRPSHMGANA